MDVVLRLVLRFILVPFGVVFALMVGVVVLVIAEWNAFAAYVNANPDAEGTVLALILVAPWVLMVIAGAGMMMLSPAAIGILIAEFFAIRSWIYHVANFALSAWVGWSLIDPPRAEERFFSDPKLVVAVGLAAGLAYWLVAGWSAGFWKPVLGRPMPTAPLAPPQS